MSPLPRENPYYRADPITPQTEVIESASSSNQSASGMDGGQGDGQIQLLNLQWWICELLMKNQQLRLKLAREFQDDHRSEATTGV